MFLPLVVYPTLPSPAAPAGPVTLGMLAVPIVPANLPVPALYVTDTAAASLLPPLGAALGAPVPPPAGGRGRAGWASPGSANTNTNTNTNTETECDMKTAVRGRVRRCSDLCHAAPRISTNKGPPAL